jgi:hypothetical protein
LCNCVLPTAFNSRGPAAQYCSSTTTLKKRRQPPSVTATFCSSYVPVSTRHKAYSVCRLRQCQLHSAYGIHAHSCHKCSPSPASCLWCCAAVAVYGVLMLFVVGFVCGQGGLFVGKGSSCNTCLEIMYVQCWFTSRWLLLLQCQPLVRHLQARLTCCCTHQQPLTVHVLLLCLLLQLDCCRRLQLLLHVLTCIHVLGTCSTAKQQHRCIVCDADSLLPVAVLATLSTQHCLLPQE